jgi:hypothetical protein
MSEMCKHEAALFHAGFEHAAVKAEHRNTCKHTISLLNDAVDAIEIGRPDVAIQRIKMTLKHLKDK